MSSPAVDTIRNNLSTLIDIMLKVCETRNKLHGQTTDRKDVIMSQINNFRKICFSNMLSAREVAQLFIIYLRESPYHMYWSIMHTGWLETSKTSPDIRIKGIDKVVLPIRAVYRYCKEIDANACENDHLINMDKIANTPIFMRQLYIIFQNASQVQLEMGGKDGAALAEEDLDFTAWKSRVDNCLKCIKQCHIIIEGEDPATSDFISLILDRFIPSDGATGQKVTKKEIMELFRDKLGGDDESITSLLDVMPDILSGNVDVDQLLKKIRNTKALRGILNDEQIETLGSGLGGILEKVKTTGGKKGPDDEDYAKIAKELGIDLGDSTASSSAPSGKKKRK